MIARRQARQARHLSDDIDRLTRGDDPRDATIDPEHRALLNAAALLNQELQGLRAARPGYQTALEARLLAQLPAARPRWWHRFTFPTRPAFSRALVGVAATILVIAIAGTAVAASSGIRIYRPEKPGTTAPVFAPFLPPPGQIAYRPADPAAAARESGRALAYLPTPPANLSEVIEVGFMPTIPSTLPPISPTTFAMRIHALVRYQGAGHSVLVVLDEPIAGQQDILLALGDRTIRLADGREAWTSIRPNWPQGNTVAFVSGSYVVIVASDLPLETVATLAGQVVVAQATTNGTSPGEPQPSVSLPPVAPTGPADLAITGKVQQGGSGNRPQLRYDVSLGNRGSGTAENVRVRIEPAPALAAHVIDPDPPRTFLSQGPGQLSGLGGTITLDVSGLDPTVVRQALAEGVTVHITWTEGGEAKETTFTIR